MKAARTSGRDASGPAAQLLATEVAELFYNLAAPCSIPTGPSVTTCAGQVPNGTRGNGGRKHPATTGRSLARHRRALPRRTSTFDTGTSTKTGIRT